MNGNPAADPVPDDRDPGPAPAAPRSGMGFLASAACVVIVVAGIKAAGDVLVQILLALFIAIVCLPVMRALRRIGLPTGLAVLGVVALVLVLLFGLAWIVAGSVAEFSESIEFYEGRLDSLVAGAVDTVQSLGFDLKERPVQDVVDSKVIFRYVGSLAGSVTATLSSVLVVVFIVVFMLLEAAGIPDKMRRAIGDPDADLSAFHEVLDQVHGYLSVKVFVSLLTGVLVWVLCVILGVDFAPLWGLIAFLLNFIPNVGSMLAAIPAVLLALVQKGSGTAGGLLVGYFVINTVIGNMLEPRLMGQRLGLSPLVVMLSLIFWSWVWGPVGMLLSVPLTTVLKIALESRDDLRPIAIMLGSAEEKSERNQDG